MNLKETDLNLFKAFDVIYTEKNLTKAGEVLGITQPAVSNALSRLREMFNDELFIRSSKGMLPTPVAQDIIGDVREALGLMNKTISQTDSFDPLTSEITFKISIGLAFCVIIYYINNFFYVLGDTEKIPLYISVWLPLIFLILVQLYFFQHHLMLYQFH